MGAAHPERSENMLTSRAPPPCSEFGVGLSPAIQVWSGGPTTPNCAPSRYAQDLGDEKGGDHFKAATLSKGTL
jgi:hypothetical protein